MRSPVCLVVDVDEVEETLESHKTSQRSECAASPPRRRRKHASPPRAPQASLLLAELIASLEWLAPTRWGASLTSTRNRHSTRTSGRLHPENGSLVVAVLV